MGFRERVADVSSFDEAIEPARSTRLRRSAAGSGRQRAEELEVRMGAARVRARLRARRDS